MAIRHPRDSRRTDRGFQWQSFHPARAAQRKASVDGFGRGRTDLGLFVGIPLYYFFGTKGIVPAMVALTLSMWIFSTISVRKEVSFPVGKFCRKDHLPVARRLVSLGILLMANDLILAIVQYAISIYVNAFGSADTLGLYQAANSVTNQYSGMVFAAMAMDYFPVSQRRLPTMSGCGRLSTAGLKSYPRSLPLPSACLS